MWPVFDWWLTSDLHTYMLMLLLQAGKQFVCLFIEPEVLWCVLNYIFNILLLVRLWLKFVVRTFWKVMLYRMSQGSATGYSFQTMSNNFDSIIWLIKTHSSVLKKDYLSNSIYKCTKSHVKKTVKTGVKTPKLNSYSYWY